MARSSSYDDTATAFRHGNFKPLYLLYGEERYFVDELQRLAIEHAVQPHERDFNMDIVYGPETDVQKVLALCASYPVMAQRRLVIVRDFDKLSENKRFKAYAEQPNPTAVVVLVASGKVNTAHHPYRAIKAQGVAVDCKRLYDRELPRWLEGEVRRRGREIEGRAVQMLAEYVGSDLQKAVREIEKVLTFAGDRERISADDVVQASGHSREVNVFELQKAVGERQFARAQRIAERLLQQASNSRGEALMIVAILTSFFTKLWILTSCQRQSFGEKDMAQRVGIPPFYLKEYLNTLKRFDASALATAFRTLASADFELKGGSSRSERLILMLALRRITGGEANAAIAA
ncbi:MAG: DNA polymerase III subunit delta [Rhodothermales bacterium]|nr:DNA polymerase III subunit delta [Rhodothermales bacterium]MBO6778374.1 DNA polymerase III subunit delta [Rhodothermales bacterium]